MKPLTPMQALAPFRGWHDDASHECEWRVWRDGRGSLRHLDIRRSECEVCGDVAYTYPTECRLTYAEIEARDPDIERERNGAMCQAP